MLILLRLLQSLIRTLHSDGTPAQVAVGVTLGAALGLTPLLSPHNLVVVSAIALLNVSVGGAVIGMLLFTPVGFLLDPVFDYMGAMLLGFAVAPRVVDSGLQYADPRTVEFQQYDRPGKHCLLGDPRFPNLCSQPRRRGPLPNHPRRQSP